jgi:hypothetical protein
VSEQDPYGPTSAGPQPTPVVGPSDATFAQPAGTAAPDGGAYRATGAGGIEEERPEVLVGAAFAGGVLAAMVLKRILRRG